MKRLHLFLVVAAMAGLMIIFSLKARKKPKRSKMVQITVVESVIEWHGQITNGFHR